MELSHSLPQSSHPSRIQFYPLLSRNCQIHSQGGGKCGEQTQGLVPDLCTVGRTGLPAILPSAVLAHRADQVKQSRERPSEAWSSLPDGG